MVPVMPGNAVHPVMHAGAAPARQQGGRLTQEVAQLYEGPAGSHLQVDAERSERLRGLILTLLPRVEDLLFGHKGKGIHRMATASG
jgi:hypothetical protein